MCQSGLLLVQLCVLVGSHFDFDFGVGAWWVLGCEMVCLILVLVLGGYLAVKWCEWLWCLGANVF